MTNTGFHRTHCCALHGCKYGDRDCPVVSLEIVQDYPCEHCDFDEDAILQLRIEFSPRPGEWVADHRDESRWFSDVRSCVIEFKKELATLVPEHYHLLRMTARTVSPWKQFGSRG